MHYVECISVDSTVISIYILVLYTLMHYVECISVDSKGISIYMYIYTCTIYTDALCRKYQCR